MPRRAAQLLERIKELEHQGYELEAAEGTFELLVREALHPGWSVFEVVNYDVTTRLVGRHHRDRDAAHPRQRPHRHRHRATVPMNALDLCLRQCLSDALSASRRTSG